LKRFLDDSDVHKILEEVLELEKNDIDMMSDEFNIENTKSLPFINRMFKNYQEHMNSEDRVLVKSLILSALECLDVILDMINTVITMKKDKNLKEKINCLHQYHMTHLSVVKYIKEALLSNSSFMTDLDDNKLLLTIASYIHFENRYSIPMNERILKAEDN